MKKDCIAIDIGEDYIKIIYGSQNKIKNFGLIRTPKDSIVDDKIVNDQIIQDIIKKYILDNNIKKKDVLFSIHGQDVIVRHLEIPLMDEKNIKDSIDWETKQYLPDYGNNHYIDFEILDKINTEEEKIFKILVVAVPKEKVDILYKITKDIDLNLVAVDLTANAISRVFRNIKDYPNSCGIIEIGASSSILMVLENGKLIIEREIPTGLFSFLGEISKDETLAAGEAYEYLTKRFNIANVNEKNEKDKNIYNKIESLCESYSKIIQFYTNGKVKKTIDKIYITGSGNVIGGLERYASNYFNTSIDIVKSASQFGLKMEIPQELDFKYFTSCVGLLLRKE
ncbi:MAG: type IV pilus assembly protein PilM [Clostridiaceae bacterium]